ncbi:hypothetical protein BDN70DRAFT_871801 [Pholiota conissans]|uniref:MYND-type domain-containing protein n=1 Tax=Pholiota conissans TaxID=109636 RepID=A0A9P5ZCU7_9AGAR|nr:hypothetical protein BDN70DRAFT_871801 [Pholiota conissans]
MPRRRSQQEDYNLEHELLKADTLIIAHSSERPVDEQSSKDIKKTAKLTRRICIRCKAIETGDVSYKACAKCQSAIYCSRECQKLDWSSHKEHCADSRRHKRLEKQVSILIANTNLLGVLKLAIILQLGLLDSPFPAEPFHVLVPLVVEPECIREFAKLRGDLRTVRAPRPKAGNGKPRGMMQISGILPWHSRSLSRDQVLDLARSAVESGASDITMDRLQDVTVGVVIFSIGELDNRGGSTLEVPLLISANMMRIAKMAEPFQYLIAANGEFWTMPMNAHSCIEFINNRIRIDHENKFLLRAEMTEADEQLVRESAEEFGEDSDSNRRLASELVKLRMSKEYVYSPLPI